jgi:hypothetical protein
MLAPILQHADDIDYVRCLFLNSNLEDSLRLISPPLYLARPVPRPHLRAESLWPASMWSFVVAFHTAHATPRAQTQELERIPLEDLALQSRFVLLLDHHTDLFIWVGRQAQDSAQLVELCRQAAASLATQRFPQPQLMIFQVDVLSHLVRVRRVRACVLY